MRLWHWRWSQLLLPLVLSCFTSAVGVLEGFPELAHDDEVDACSGALEMLNPQMKGWGYYEWMRRQMQALKEQRKPQPPKTNWAPGSVEWQAEQEEKRKAQIEAAAVE
jgi:hypothetical protein